jgi:precorrin-3B synthase
MSARGELRKGWCPGALRPMQTGDGLLVRVRPRAGAFPLPALKVIAEAAAAFGSGEIDLTNRANLQLRGLNDATFPDAITALGRAGLLDDNADAEAVRNVVADPLCGLDPSRADLRSLAAELETILTEHTALHALPGKFGFSISGSTRPLDGQTAADIMIAAFDKGSCAIRLDGDARIHAVVDRSKILGAVERLVAAFLTLQSSTANVRRMRDAVAVTGSSKLFASAGLETRIAAGTRASITKLAGAIGPAAAPFAVGIGLAFGRITANELLNLSTVALDLGCTEVRPSQHRTLVVPVSSPAAATALLAHASKSNLIIGSDDIRLAMDVCPGAPSCSNATTNTRADAQRLVSAFEGLQSPMPSVHISGCEKGCARRASAALTFVARDGAYDAISNGPVDGSIVMAGIAPQNLSAAAAQILAERT